MRGRDSGVEKARHIQPIVSRDKTPQENPPIRRYLHDTGKSLFVWDCVVELGGLEPPTKRLSSNCPLMGYASSVNTQPSHEHFVSQIASRLPAEIQTRYA